MSRHKQVELELNEMRKLGMRVPQAAFNQLKKLSDDELATMRVSEAADLCVSLA
jgi:hypothetical protein